MKMLARWGNIGEVVITRGLNADVTSNKKLYDEVQECFQRYLRGDWGELCEEDKQLNDDAIRTKEDRILAKYETSTHPIYIITEWDRSYTTLLYCNEY